MSIEVQEVAVAARPAGAAPADRAPLVSLMGASFSTGNLGVSALASGTIASIRAGIPGARVFLLDYGVPAIGWTGDAASGQLKQLNLRFSKWAWLPNNIARLLLLACLVRLVPVRAWRRRLARRSAWLRRISDPDFHLSLAGGDSFSDIYGLGRLAYMALPQILVLLLDKPLILLPQTYGPFNSRLARALAGWILRRASGIYSRDREGLATVKLLQRGRGPQPRFAYDMGFGLEPCPPAPEAMARVRALRRNGPLVGFNISGLLYIGGYGKDNSFKLESGYPDLIRALLDVFVADHNVQVLLVPHVYGEEENSESDLGACRQFADRFGKRYQGHLHLLDGSFDHHQAKRIIGECEFFVGSRMHACIAALSQCVPAVGLAYSRKFAGVMESVGEGAVVVDLRTRGMAEIVAAVEAAWLARESMRGQLVARMPAIKKSVLTFFQQPEFCCLLKPGRP